VDFRSSLEGAIRVGFDNYANFNGRAARRQYWFWVLFAVLVGLVAGLVDGIIGTGTVLGVIASLALLLPGLAYAARRMHDIGKSGWYVLVAVIPVLGWIYFIYLAVQPGEPQANAWGAAPAA
jgi:uncharacterized membrane protein YhaH (DUF805 family)